ncbi:MAG: PEP/pyruvate-binding domain-containing protein [Endozoicomonas sp. (ex Botrylloides leachii)]|nr:PEP/pyruvate-binding domain-containing protein [Endozoicomonas sp. (ex Botrylloides leachii)]
MEFKSVQAASYAWNTNPNKGFLAAVIKIKQAVGVFFYALFKGFQVSEVDQDNYLSVEWRKNTIAGRAFLAQKLKDRSVISTNAQNNISTSGHKQPTVVGTEQQAPSCLRTKVGGKGMFLYHMKTHGIPVPAFHFVSIPDIQSLEKVEFSKKQIPVLLANIQLLEQQDTVSIDQLKKHIANISNPEEKARLLTALSEFLISDAFYRIIKNHPTALLMRDRFNELSPDGSQQKVIIRSSGAQEDSYGDAQAGKYESCVHNTDDIVRSCLKVLASGYRPEVCQNGMPTTLSLVMQRCVECQFGGVAMSHTGLNNNQMQIEYAPGQPKSTVSGVDGLIPHRYTVTRKHHQPVLEHIEGNISQVYYLESQDNNKAVEQLTPITSSEMPKLPEPIAKTLYDTIVKLENLLQCPVDVEFGIDQHNKVQILQVRPITRLPGGAKFAAGIPSEALAKGTLVSEGLCKGPVIPVEVGSKPENLPKNAIIVAHHGENWMLTPEVANHVSGFIFEQGGTGDHVAITLRQAGKPCIIADNKPAVINGDIATLVCGEFNGQSGGFLVNGGQAYDRYQEQRLPAASADFSAAIAKTHHWQPNRCDASRVDHQFQWLNGQNKRLLDYFNGEGLISRCLSPEGTILVSMSSQRPAILKALKNEVAHVFSDIDALLKGYETYLKAGTKGEGIPKKIKEYLAALGELKTQTDQIKEKVNNDLDKVTKGLMDGDELLQNIGDFSQWQAACQSLRSRLQQLSQPRCVNHIESIHDIIFLVHKNFVDILADVANASGQGTSNKTSDQVTIVNFKMPGMTQLLDDHCIAELEHYGNKNTVLNMDGVSIISTDINYHKGVIELIDKGAGNQGRLMRIRVLDSFSEGIAHLGGKFKRFLWLALLLNSIGQQNSNQGVHIKLNEELGELIVEIDNIPDIEQMRRQLIRVMRVLSDSTNLDNYLTSNLNGFASIHDFAGLQAYLKRIQDDDSQFMANVLIFKMAFDNPKNRMIKSLEEFFSPESDENNLIMFSKGIQWLKRSNEPTTILETSFQKNSEQIRCLLVVNPEKVVSSVRLYSDWLSNKKEALSLVALNGELLKYLSPKLQKDREIVTAAALHNPKALQFGGAKFWNDKEILSTVARANPEKYAQQKVFLLSRNALLEGLKLNIKENSNIIFRRPLLKYLDDAEVMLAAVKQDENYLSNASEALKDDVEFMKKAIKANYQVYSHGSDRIKSAPSIAALFIKCSGGAVYVWDELPEALQNQKNIKELYIDGLQKKLTQLQKAYKSMPSTSNSYYNFSARNLVREMQEVAHILMSNDAGLAYCPS